MVESCSDAKWSSFGMLFEYQTAQSFEKWLSFLSFSYPFSCTKSPSFLWNSSPKWLTLLSWEQQIFIYHYGPSTLDSRTLDFWPKKTLDSWDIGFLRPWIPETLDSQVNLTIPVTGSMIYDFAFWSATHFNPCNAFNTRNAFYTCYVFYVCNA